MAYTDPDGAGVGGWLAFFMLVMAVFSPLAIAFTTATALYGNDALAQTYPDRWTMIQTFEWTLATLTIAGCWYIAWRLNKVHVWRTVQITIIGMWLLSVGPLVAEVLGLSVLTGIPVANMFGAADPELARPFVFSLIWTAYFLRSERVANTYPRHEAEVAEVFG